MLHDSMNMHAKQNHFDFNNSIADVRLYWNKKPHGNFIGTGSKLFRLTNARQIELFELGENFSIKSWCHTERKHHLWTIWSDLTPSNPLFNSITIWVSCTKRKLFIRTYPVCIKVIVTVSIYDDIKIYYELRMRVNMLQSSACVPRNSKFISHFFVVLLPTTTVLYYYYYLCPFVLRRSFSIDFIHVKNMWWFAKRI